MRSAKIDREFMTRLRNTGAATEEELQILLAKAPDHVFKLIATEVHIFAQMAEEGKLFAPEPA